MAEIPGEAVLPSIDPSIQAPDVTQQIEPKAGAGLQAIGGAALKTSQFMGQLQTSDVTADALQKAQSVLDNYSKLNGKAAVDAEASTNQQISDIFNGAEGELHSPDQIAQFQQIAREYQTRYFGGRVSEFADQGRRQWIAQSNQSTREVALNGISSDPNSDANFSVYLNQLRSANIKDLQATGNASDPTISAATIQRSDAAAWKARIGAVAPTNPQLALQWTKQNQAMLGTDYAPMAEELQNRADKASADTAVDGLFTGTAPMAPYDGAPVQSLSPDQASAQWQAESGGRQFGPDGKTPLTSPKGAIGVAQMIPTTAQETADAHGIPWDPTKFATDGSYNQQLGTLHMNDLLQQYSGNYPLALAAYNAGPNNPGVLHFASTGDPSLLPDETKRYISTITGGGNTKAQIYQKIEASGQSDQWKSYAFAHADQVLTEQQIAQQNQAAMTHAQSEKYASDFATQIWSAQDAGKPVSPDIIKQIDAAPLDYSTKDSLRRIALSATGQAQTIGYGPGYTTAFNNILLPYGADGKITSNAQILQLQASGQLTSSGARDLMSTLHDATDTTGAGLATAKAGLLNYARSKLSFQDDTGPVQIKDPAGQALYNTKFIPMFEASYSAWQKAGKDPLQYPVDQIDKMVTSLRSPAQMAADQISALGNSDIPGTATPNPTPDTPPPPPPAAVENTAQWGTYMAQPPQTQNGPISSGQWGEAIEMLLSNPKQNIPLFDKVFAPYGYDGAEIVQQLSNGPAAPAAPYTIRAKGVNPPAPASGAN